MKRDRNPPAGVPPDDLDRGLSRILGGESENDRLGASSGFAAKVMESICDGVATPAPLPFPWKRTFVTFGGASAILLYALLSVLHELRRLPPPGPSAVPLHLPAAFASVAMPLGWMTLALLIALLSITLCFRFAAPRT